MSVHFRVETNSDLPPELLFRRSLSVDEHVASMAASGERAVGGVTAGQIAAGQTVTWKARHFCVRFSMTSLVTEVDHPRRFMDHQVKGPFSSFHHIHTFMPSAAGTLMVDEIAFAAPCGMLGRIAERLFLARYLRRLIIRRNEFLCRPR
ncbi:SRPBCC family protein [Arthrobacter sp. A2-55]|uniref:SRPBCC family protein n=1 Tax=Arthrobacter sp. A2-55 TaxID=2897337 RepID=UPI0021CDE379|nr:SRPBCC family protein [Arthrobacter sp. A2-55]MCU6478836.1 SRPBCC family protein [Arthrobacter sp. A2-55]